MKFNTGMDARRFTWRVAQDARVFRHPLGDWREMEVIGDYQKRSLVPDKTIPPFLPAPVTVLRPTVIPKSFTGPYGTKTTIYDASTGGWTLSQLWLSEAGGLISLTQVSEFTPDEETGAPNGKLPVISVHGAPARVWIYHEPFEGVSIFWQEGRRYYRLDGTGVSAPELQKMAESLKEVVVKVTDQAR